MISLTSDTETKPTPSMRQAIATAEAGDEQKGLSEIDGINVLNPQPETNMVFFDVAGLGLDTATFLARLQEQGVKMGAIGNNIRAVTHLDVSQTDIEKAIQAIAHLAQFKDDSSRMSDHPRRY